MGVIYKGLTDEILLATPPTPHSINVRLPNQTRQFAINTPNTVGTDTRVRFLFAQSDLKEMGSNTLCILVTLVCIMHQSIGIAILPNWFSCSFHESCIEAIFPCGPQGLALGYAKPRCQGISVLNQSDSGCHVCIQSQAILDWLITSENCFQASLLTLARNQNLAAYPDPPDCLDFEKEALELLGTCYLEEDAICRLVNSDSVGALDSDLKVVLDTILVSSYYESAVTRHARNILESCNSPLSTSLANQIAPETERMSLCVSFYSHNGLTEEGLTEALAGKLNQSSTDFAIASFDPKLDASCQQKSDPAWSVSSADYLLVHWTLEKGADKSALTTCNYAGSCHVDNDKSLVYFQYTSLTTSSCGDGRREATESCDLFVYTGMDGYGCSEQCEAVASYECTTEQLQQSFCRKARCGDGLRTSDEECDEGDESFVGCNPQSCTIEDGYHCQTPYNSTSQCSPLVLKAIPTSTGPNANCSPFL